MFLSGDLRVRLLAILSKNMSRLRSTSVYAVFKGGSLFCVAVKYLPNSYFSPGLMFTTA